MSRACQYLKAATWGGGTQLVESTSMVTTAGNLGPFPVPVTLCHPKCVPPGPASPLAGLSYRLLVCLLVRPVEMLETSTKGEKQSRVGPPVLCGQRHTMLGGVDSDPLSGCVQRRAAEEQDVYLGGGRLGKAAHMSKSAV